MFDKASIRKKIEYMTSLPEDWNGFGSSPLGDSVARTD